MQRPWLSLLRIVTVVLVCHGAAAAEAQGASSQNSASVGNEQQKAAGAQQQLDTPRTSANTADSRVDNAAAVNGITAAAVRGAAGKGSSLPMQDCSNDDSGLPLASLKVEAAWESHGLREDSDITIVTQMSPRRARAMTELCYQWGGVVSVATYVPLLNGTLVAEEGAPADWTVPDVIRHLSAFHKQMETEGPCKLDMVLYSEAVAGATMAAFYPVNALRNRALAQAKTELVMLDDVDFIVSGGLSDPEHYPAILRLCRAGRAVVLPALEPADVLGIKEGTRVALRAVQEGKQRAAAQYRKKRLKPFHIERWDLAHRATEYDRWTTAKDFYDIEYEHDFEPYIVVQRKKLPAYDERLRGYFENKAVHCRHLATLGMKFAVHPTEFVVHLPHKESAARLMIIDPANAALRDKVQGLGHRMREWIDAGAYTPVTTDTCTPEEQQAAAQRYKRRAAAEASAAAGADVKQQGSNVGAQGAGDAAEVGASGAAQAGAAHMQQGSTSGQAAGLQMSEAAQHQNSGSSGKQHGTLGSAGGAGAASSSEAASEGVQASLGGGGNTAAGEEVRRQGRGAGSDSLQTSDAATAAKTTDVDSEQPEAGAGAGRGSSELQSRPEEIADVDAV